MKFWDNLFFGFIWLLYSIGILSLLYTIYTSIPLKENAAEALTAESYYAGDGSMRTEKKKSDDEFLRLIEQLNLNAMKVRELDESTRSMQQQLQCYGLAVSTERRSHDKFVDSLLQIVDACEPFIEPAATGNPEIEGKAAKRIKSVHIRLQDILENENISEMAVYEGETFDPRKHEIANNDIEKLAEQVVVKKVQKKGYVSGPTIVRKALIYVENKQ